MAIGAIFYVFVHLGYTIHQGAPTAQSSAQPSLYPHPNINSNPSDGDDFELFERISQHSGNDEESRDRVESRFFAFYVHYLSLRHFTLFVLVLAEYFLPASSTSFTVEQEDHKHEPVSGLAWDYSNMKSFRGADFQTVFIENDYSSEC